MLGRYTAQLALKDDVTRLYDHKVEKDSQQGYRYVSPVMSSEFCDNNTSVCFRRQCFIIDDCCLQKYKKLNKHRFVVNILVSFNLILYFCFQAFSFLLLY